MLNPELKNLNLKAVEKIVLQKLLDSKSLRSDQHYMKHRSSKYRSRLKTAGNINTPINDSVFGQDKPLSAQVSIRGVNELQSNGLSNFSIIDQNVIFQRKAQNELRLMKLAKELEEEMK